MASSEHYAKYIGAPGQAWDIDHLVDATEGTDALHDISHDYKEEEER